MKICVIGTGYVGLVSGVCLAGQGHDVICVDNDASKLDSIRSGKSPIHETGLDELLADVLGSRLTVTGDTARAVRESDLSLIAVGTPFDGKEIDLRFVETVARDIGAALTVDKYHVVVVKSTVVPGTTDGVVRRVLEEASGLTAGKDFGLGMNPEFLTEGSAVQDFRFPDRIVVGGIDERARQTLRSVYADFEGVPILETNNKTAEMIKYASNSLLAAMISFSNEIANLGSAIGDIDAAEVMEGVHLSTYLSKRGADGSIDKAGIASFLMPGCGFGGSCLPKDVSALVAQGRSLNQPMGLLAQVLTVNAEQPKRFLDILRRHVPDLSGRKIGVLGLAFKPDTDDLRESPAIPIVRLLEQAGAAVVAYDPIAMPAAKKHPALSGLDYADSLADVLRGADAVLLVTRWAEFAEIPGLLEGMPEQPLIVDGRRLLDKSSVERYDAIGL